MNNEYIHELRHKLKSELENDKARYWHSIGVANTCACLAMRYNVDMERAYIAGLLHDCAKCYSDENLIKMCEKNNIYITEAEKISPYLLHSKYGAFLAETKYNIYDKEICSSIVYHTTGRADMSILEEIVFIADYIEPFRNKADNLDEIRAEVFIDIKKAVYKVTKSTLEYLDKKHKPIDPMTVETYEYYKKIVEEM